MIETSECLSLFNFHDSTIETCEIPPDLIVMDLDFGHVGSEHPSNSFGRDQCIKPCEVKFKDISEQSTQVWNDHHKEFRAHPDALHPVSEIYEFKVEEVPSSFKVEISGFHMSGWAEWRFSCKSIMVSWGAFAGDAWYESKTWKVNK